MCQVPLQAPERRRSALNMLRVWDTVAPWQHNWLPGSKRNHSKLWADGLNDIIGCPLTPRSNDPASLSVRQRAMFKPQHGLQRLGYMKTLPSAQN